METSVEISTVLGTSWFGAGLSPHAPDGDFREIEPEELKRARAWGASLPDRVQAASRTPTGAAS